MQVCPGLKFFKNLNISCEICVNVFTTDPKCQYFIRNMFKYYMGPPWIPIRTYMDPMWGPSGPSMAPNQDPTLIKSVHS